MDFTRSSIAPMGRNKYGQYISGKNVAVSTAKYTYNGNVNVSGGSRGGGSGTGGGGNEPAVEQPNFVIFLEKTYGTFDRAAMALSTGQTATFRAIGYRNNQLVPVYVGDCSVHMDDQMNPPASSSTYNISGITPGVTVTVSGNGSTDCVIAVNLKGNFAAAGGTLDIPLNVSSDFNVSGDDYYLWLMENEYNSEKYGGQPSLFSSILQYTFVVDDNSAAAAAYVLNLTNDSAGINVDSAGNVLSGATRPTCKAELWYGSQKLTSGVTYGLTTNPEASASGVSINTSTGVLTFGSNFNFLGTGLECTVSATHSGITLEKKMTVTKQFPGADGTGATTRWIVASRDEIKFNPNNSSLTPSAITATIMMQVNDAQPETDTASVLYWGWDTETPTNTGRTGTVISVLAGHQYLSIGLKNSSNVFYELETIPVMEAGQNGAPGASGDSAYVLQLDNQFQFVNVTSGGTVVDGQESNLSTTATLYYGKDPAANAVYSLVGTWSNISIDSSTGVVTFSQGWGSQMTADTMQITIQAKVNNVLYGETRYSLVKNYPQAENGEDAVKYWLVLSATAAHVDSGATVADPSTITAVAWQQTGGNTPVMATGATIVYGFNTTNPTTPYPSGGIQIDVTKKYLTIKLTVNNYQYDIQTIPILKDGAAGESIQGRTGAAIRGPYEWTAAMDRRFSSGNGPLEEDYLFKDVIFRMSGSTKVYYTCINSYTQTGSTTWDAVSSNWSGASVNYDFVAADLILAENAKINFMSGNEIYVMTSGNTPTVCGGMRGVSGDTDIVIWAGDETPSNAEFKVAYDGSMTASKGKIGPWTISGNTGLSYYYDDGVENILDAHLNTNELVISYETAGNHNNLYAGSNGVHFSSENSEHEVILSMEGGHVVFGDGFTMPTGVTPSFWCDIPIRRDIYHNPVIIEELNVSGDTIEFGAYRDSNRAYNKYRAACGNNPTTVKIVYVTSGNTSGSYFSSKLVDGYYRWHFNGDMNLGITSSGANSYPYLTICTSTMISNYNYPSDWLGYWLAASISTGQYAVNTGIAGPNVPKKGDTIYITI